MALLLLIALVLALVLALFETPAFSGMLPIALVVIGVAVLVDALVAWRKERYLLSERQIVRKGGGILRDSHTELNVANITHVRLILPWPRYPLFGIGHVEIDSAGSGEHVRLRALADPHGVYERVRALMGTNGFSLTYRQRLHEEQPPMVAVLREWSGGLGTALSLMVVILVAAGGLTASPGLWGVVLPIALGVAALGALGAWLAVRGLDLRRRTYTVYNDAVVYTEGFLTRRNAFLPAENLADANTEQTLLARLLGLYDVTISCQGSGQQIV
ncbi:MAG: PH domain-containing protein, partial [Phycisphaeraceae bacterium]